jgi:hypothetical protein
MRSETLAETFAPSTFSCRERICALMELRPVMLMPLVTRGYSRLVVITMTKGTAIKRAADVTLSAVQKAG